MDQKKTIRPFSMKDKIGYTLGDLGCCFTEQYRAMYLSIFYTLILQVNPFHVGILLLITKIWDAVNDPIIGALVDSRKATKGGKFIPWIRAFSFPMAVLCVLAFVNVGNISYGLRLAYMFITYVLYEALYTCVNVPFGTLSSVMTDDVSQRTALSRYRSLGGTIFMTVMVISIMTSLNWLIKLETTEARFPSFASITPTNRANTMMGSISPFAMEPIGFFGMMLSSVSTRLTLESAAVEDRSAF